MRNPRLYMDTALHLKPSQVGWRVWRRLGGATPLKAGFASKPDLEKADVSRIPVLPELEFAPGFLARFDVDAILAGEIELLHRPRRADWSAETWQCEGETALWRYNVQYCEYLLPLAKRFLDEGDERCLDLAKRIVRAWIARNPHSGGGAAWDPYTISMRAVSWLSFYGECREALDADSPFVCALNASLAEQYSHLSQHLEKDLLANHYLEDLKALVILACYFGDKATLVFALPELEAQVAEQVLPDGAHFELSPMYQKVILEDLLRVSVCLRAFGSRSETIESRLKPMCDFVYSMERGANRTPLFNDSGDNVAKPASALLECAKRRFGIEPDYHAAFPDAGYYLLEGECGGRAVKVILDVGEPGPAYACGHAHCDMLSIEVFVDGEPWVVNAGTYAYQDGNRLDWKRTAAHSTVQVDGVEQSECWAPFRMARMAKVRNVEAIGRKISATMIDQAGNSVTRTVDLTSLGVRVDDRVSADKKLVQRFHFPAPPRCALGRASCRPYAPEFGLILELTSVEIYGEGEISTLLDPAENQVTDQKLKEVK